MKTYRTLRSALAAMALTLTCSAPALAAHTADAQPAPAARKAVYSCTVQTTGNCRYEYAADNRGRVISKTAYRWNDEARAWKPAYRYTVSYGTHTNTLTYAAYDEARRTFSARMATARYDAAAYPILIAAPVMP